MTDLYIASTQDTPEVNFSITNNLFEISGRSLPENGKTFFEPVIGWLSEYLKTPSSTTTFVFKLQYFNSSSSKQLYHIIYLLQQFYEAGGDIKIKWMYQQDDELMFEEGEQFEDMFYVPIELVSY